jgi:hypothetical protein
MCIMTIDFIWHLEQASGTPRQCHNIIVIPERFQNQVPELWR